MALLYCCVYLFISALVFFFKQKTAYEMRISDWSSDVCSSDLITPSGNVHGMPVACLCGIGPDVLTSLGGHVPEIEPAQVRQIGIRSVDQEEKRLVKQHGLDIYDMRYIDEVGMKQVMEEALAGLDADTHLHVSFDVDMLDPSIAPGTGTKVPGGVNYREGQLIMEMIADSGRIDRKSTRLNSSH